MSLRQWVLPHTFVAANTANLSLVQFNQTVKIRSIALQTENIPQGPRTIRLLINRPSVSFEDAEEQQAIVQEIELTEDDLREGRKLPLRFVRFQSITSLHVGYAPFASRYDPLAYKGCRFS